MSRPTDSSRRRSPRTLPIPADVDFPVADPLNSAAISESLSIHLSAVVDGWSRQVRKSVRTTRSEACAIALTLWSESVTGSGSVLTEIRSVESRLAAEAFRYFRDYPMLVAEPDHLGSELLLTAEEAHRAAFLSSGSHTAGFASAIDRLTGDSASFARGAVKAGAKHGADSSVEDLSEHLRRHWSAAVSSDNSWAHQAGSAWILLQRVEGM